MPIPESLAHPGFLRKLVLGGPGWRTGQWLGWIPMGKRVRVPVCLCIPSLW